jgi:hypothetical protein
MRLLARETMPVRCAGCAYTKGTAANGDSLTTITRELCELGQQPFFCHANAVEDVLPKVGKRVCRGFADVILTQVITGREPQRWQRLLADEALRLMEEEEDRAKSNAPERSRDDVMRVLIARVEKRLVG